MRRCVVRCDLETWSRPTQGCRSNDDDDDDDDDDCLNIIYNARRAMPQAVNRQPLVTDTGIRSQISPRKGYSGQSDIRTDMSPSSSAFRCHYHFTNAPYWIQFLNNSCVPRSS